MIKTGVADPQNFFFQTQIKHLPRMKSEFETFKISILFTANFQSPPPPRGVGNGMAPMFPAGNAPPLLGHNRSLAAGKEWDGK